MRNGLPAAFELRTGGGGVDGAGAGAVSCFLQDIAIEQRNSMPRHVKSNVLSFFRLTFIDGFNWLSEFQSLIYIELGFHTVGYINIVFRENKRSFQILQSSRAAVP